MTSALSRSDTRTKNRSLQIANDALYPSYGESWRDEIDVGPQDPEPGDLLFNEEELSPGVNQLGFEWLVKQLQINPEIAGGILLPGETPEGGKGGLGSMNKDQLERWIKENGITGPGADKIRNKWKNLGPNLPLANLDPAAQLRIKALKDASKPGLSSKEIRKILKPFTKPDQFGHPSGSMKII